MCYCHKLLLPSSSEFSKENTDAMEKGLRVDFRGLERRVEECVAIAGNSVSSVQVNGSVLFCCCVLL